MSTTTEEQMDPFSHALIGANIAGLAGHQISFSDPVFLGPVLASMAPDLDIVMQLKGDLAYIQNHRGFSHSFPALLIWSGIITIVLHLTMPATVPIQTLFLVTAAGAFSHSLFDMFNSYGVRLLWPLVKRKIAFNVVSLVDWLIVTLSILSLIIGTYRSSFAFSVWAVFMCAYILHRKWIALCLRRFLRNNYSEYEIQKVVILPARYQIFSWDFLVETKGLFMIGKIHAFSYGTEVCSKMEKPKSNPFIQAALDSSLGKLFSEFTPHFHVMYEEKDCQHTVQFTDLRYFHKNDFMHTGSICLDEQCCAIEQVFHPYNRRHRVVIG